MKEEWDKGLWEFVEKLTSDVREIIRAQLPDISEEVAEEAFKSALYAAGGALPVIGIAVSVGGLSSEPLRSMSKRRKREKSWSL